MAVSLRRRRRGSTTARRLLVCALLVVLALPPFIAAAAGSASITGRVLDAQGTPIPSIEARLWQYSGGAWSPYYGVTATTTAGGDYTFTGVPAGKTFAVEFRDVSGDYAGEFFDDARTVADATPIVLAVGETRSGVDAVLVGAASISGTVRDGGGSPVAGVTVNAYRRRGGSYETTVAASCTSLTDGSYALSGLPADEYGLQFFSGAFAGHFHSIAASAGVTAMQLATPITLSEGQALSGVDETMLRWGHLSGSVTSGGLPVAAAFIQPLRSEDTSWVLQSAGCVSSDPGGGFSAERLYPGRYRLLFTAAGLPSQYHATSTSLAYATDVVVSEDETTTLAASLLASDTAAPITSASGIPDGWVRGHADISLTASDGADGSGVAESWSCLDAAAAVPYEGPVRVSGEGVHAFAYWSEDRFGNAESAHEATIRIDDTPPRTSAALPAGWVREPVEVSLDASDNLSGVACSSLSVGASQPSTYSMPVLVSEEGSHAVLFHSVDRAGNREATVSAAVRLDMTPPETSASVQPSYVGTASITLGAADALSGVALTRTCLDGRSATGTVVTESRPGTHTLDFASLDVAGNVEETRTVSFVVAPPGVVADEIAGADRFETAAEVSRRAFPEGASTVVLATARNWPDALGGAALARAYDGPVLITERAVLPSVIASEVARLKATQVFVLGSEAAVSEEVMTAVARLADVEHVTRIGGADRYRTAELIAGEVVRKLGPDASRKAIVSTGAKFPDALAAAPLSASCGWPLYLVGRDSLSAATRSAMATQGVHGALVLGSDRSIAASVEHALATDYGDANVLRVQGETRYGTAAAIAAYAAEGRGLGWDGLALAKGTDFPDALVGGVLQSRRRSVILLTPPAALATETAACLAALPAPVTRVTYLGDEKSIQPAVREQVESLLRH